MLQRIHFDDLCKMEICSFTKKLRGPCPHNWIMCRSSMPSSLQNFPLLFCTTAFSAEGDVSTLSMKSSNLSMCISCILRHGGPGWVDFHFQISNDESCSFRSLCSKSTICGSILAAVDWAVSTSFVVVQPMVESITSGELKGKCLLATERRRQQVWRVCTCHLGRRWRCIRQGERPCSANVSHRAKIAQ